MRAEGGRVRGLGVGGMRRRGAGMGGGGGWAMTMPEVDGCSDGGAEVDGREGRVGKSSSYFRLATSSHFSCLAKTVEWKRDEIDE